MRSSTASPSGSAITWSSAEVIRCAFREMLAENPELGEIIRCDIAAVYDRDPGVRAAHRAGALFQGLPRHPDAPSGARALAEGPHGFRPLSPEPLVRGIPDRHSSGGADRARSSSSTTRPAWWSAVTAVIEDDVSILQDVTLGGTGKHGGDRHPKIRHGVLIGAGAKILGNIEVGENSRVAAGSVVLTFGAAAFDRGRRAGAAHRQGRRGRAGPRHGPDDRRRPSGRSARRHRGGAAWTARRSRSSRRSFAGGSTCRRSRCGSGRRRTTPPRSTSTTSSSAWCSATTEDGDLSYNFTMAILDIDLE